MAGNRRNRLGYCPFNHKPGSPQHREVTYKGKPFVATDHRAELTSLGLMVQKDELKADKAANRRPPGNPKPMGGGMVYPARHFA